MTGKDKQSRIVSLTPEELRASIPPEVQKEAGKILARMAVRAYIAQRDRKREKQ